MASVSIGKWASPGNSPSVVEAYFGCVIFMPFCIVFILHFLIYFWSLLFIPIDTILPMLTPHCYFTPIPTKHHMVFSKSAFKIELFSFMENIVEKPWVLLQPFVHKSYKVWNLFVEFTHSYQLNVSFEITMIKIVSYKMHLMHWGCAQIQLRCNEMTPSSGWVCQKSISFFPFCGYTSRWLIYRNIFCF